MDARGHRRGSGLTATLFLEGSTCSAAVVTQELSDDHGTTLNFLREPRGPA